MSDQNNALRRYSRQLTIEGWGKDAQRRLGQMTAFIAGAGGLGSPVLLYLAAAGVGTLRICDCDRVDITNLNRQIIHSGQSIGVNKAESACAAIRQLNPGVKAIPLTERIVPGNAERLVAGSDIIIDCLDNFKARHVLNRLSVKGSIPFVHAGVTEFHGQLGFFHPPETPCLACFYPRNPAKKSLPIAGATAGVIGALQAMEAIKALTGIGENLKNRILFFEGREMRFTTMAVSKNPKCRVCGGSEGPHGRSRGTGCGRKGLTDSL